MERIMLIWILGMRRDPEEGLSTVLRCTQLKIVNIARHMFICYFWSCANVSLSLSLSTTSCVSYTDVTLAGSSGVWTTTEVFSVTHFPIWLQLLVFVSAWESWRPHRADENEWKWSQQEATRAGSGYAKPFVKAVIAFKMLKWWLTVGCSRDRLRRLELWVSVPRKFNFADYQFQVDKGADKTEETWLCAMRFISTDDCVCTFRKCEITRW